MYSNAERDDLAKVWEGMYDGVCRCWHYGGQNRDAGHDSESAFSPNEQLFQVVS